MFFKGSRYEKVAAMQTKDSTGRVISYLKVRFIPPTPAVMGHGVVQGERLDQISFASYKDAQRFWRICDANETLWPDDLTATAGATILVPPSEG